MKNRWGIRPGYSGYLILILIIALLSISCGSGSVSSVPLPSIPLAQNSQPGAAWRADGTIGNGEYQNQQSFSSAFTIYWSNDEPYIYCGMQASTPGWLAIAILPEKKADQSIDMILGRVKNGQASVLDLFNSDHHRGNGPHQVDAEIGGSDDILEFGGQEKDNITTLEFKHNLITGDRFDLSLHAGTNYISWAYSDTDELESAHAHSTRGYGQIELK
jgi:hypothetical protein